MIRLNESQLEAVRMFEENYSYSVIAKKLGRTEVWVSKSTRHWKTNLAESFQNQSRWQLTNKTALNLTAQRIISKSKYQTLHSTGRLASKFARFLSDWKHVEHYGCRCLCQPRAAETEMLLCINIEPTHCLEIMLSSHYSTIFGYCDIKFACLWST